MANERNAKGQLLPGNSGRPKGSRNKWSGVVDDVLRHWREGGHKAMQITFCEDPQTYFRIVMSAVPKELLLMSEKSDDYATMSDDELIKKFMRIMATPTVEKADDEEKTSQVH